MWSHVSITIDLSTFLTTIESTQRKSMIDMLSIVSVALTIEI